MLDRCLRNLKSFGRRAFLVRICVQGAWGVIPVRLNQLSRSEARGTFPGLVYQLGNLIASYQGTFQAGLAKSHGDDYSLPPMLVVGIVAVVIAVTTGISFGVEARGVDMGKSEPAASLG